MGETLHNTAQKKDPFSGFYLYEPGPEGLKQNRNSYPRMWGLLLAQIVEIPDGSNRRNRIGKLYQLAHEYGFPADEMNGYYEDALVSMKRERNVADEIEYATAAETGERVQVWPPDMKAVDMLRRVTVRRPEDSGRFRLTKFE